MIQGRIFLRDAVLEHFGVPREIMGITESSNRATSEAAQYIYAQNVLTPRLKRRSTPSTSSSCPSSGKTWFGAMMTSSPKTRNLIRLWALTDGTPVSSQKMRLARSLECRRRLTAPGRCIKSTFSDLICMTLR